jgi:predicted HicB family RNase H-like nuclease
MSTFAYKGYSARVELVAEENLICGMVVGIFDTILFQGETVKEAKMNFEKAIDFFSNITQ